MWTHETEYSNTQTPHYFNRTCPPGEHNSFMATKALGDTQAQLFMYIGVPS